jgi:hypothetical protein
MFRQTKYGKKSEMHEQPQRHFVLCCKLENRMSLSVYVRLKNLYSEESLYFSPKLSPSRALALYGAVYKYGENDDDAGC